MLRRFSFLFLTLLMSLSLAMFIVGCDDDDDGDDNGGNGGNGNGEVQEGTMIADINGESWSSTTETTSAMLLEGYLSMAGANSNGSWTIGVGIEGTEIGNAYTVGLNHATNISVTNSNGKSFTTNHTDATGEVIIDEITDSYAKGTFHCTAYNIDDDSSVSVTNGEFYVTLN